MRWRQWAHRLPDFGAPWSTLLGIGELVKLLDAASALMLAAACVGLNGAVRCALHEAQTSSLAELPECAHLSDATARRLLLLRTAESQPATHLARPIAPSFRMHVHRAIVSHHAYAYYGGEEILVLCAFSYRAADGLTRLVRVFDDWSDDDHARGDTEVMDVHVCVPGLAPASSVHQQFRLAELTAAVLARLARPARPGGPVPGPPGASRGPAACRPRAPEGVHARRALPPLAHVAGKRPTRCPSERTPC